MMNIAYKGTFLREGLLDKGHHIYDLDMEDGKNLDAALKTMPAPIDLVLWEFFGAFSGVSQFSRCDVPVAAYCIDTPLNEFWLTPCMKNVDYVFVDQPQCVPSLAKNNIQAWWLPLPAQKSWLQPRRAKKYDITFIGTTNGFRLKRTNLLNLIKSKFDINIMSGINIAETQKIFAESKIVLNENFFPGLTMRVLQGLSAAAIVFTEQSPYGHSFGLEDKVDLICYNPENMLERLASILDNYDAYAHIGIQGQKKCGELYSGSHVVGELISRIDTDGRRKKDIDGASWIWNQTVAELLFAQRFGGNCSESIRRLKTLASSASERAADARLLMGDMQARFKGCQTAMDHYRAALDIYPGSAAALKLALLHVQANEPDLALKSILGWLRHAPRELHGNIADILKSGKDLGQSLLSSVCEIYFSLGRQWWMGFQKQFKDPVPDTAFDVARMAWEMRPSAWALDMMGRCLKPYHIQGELLPYMLTGIRAGILSNKQILEIARTAFEYYDRETASTIMSAMEKAG